MSRTAATLEASSVRSFKNSGKRVPAGDARVEPDREDTCLLTSLRGWSRGCLVWIALLEEPIEILGPPG